MAHEGYAFPSSFTLILASQSPRRHSLLRDLGIPFEVVPSDAEELIVGSAAPSLAEKNALAKVKGALLPPGLPEGAFVLGTDTLVAVAGRVMGKAQSIDEAREMLNALAGRTHEVVSGVALGRTAQVDAGRRATSRGRRIVLGGVRVAHAVTEVTFSSLDAADIDAYLAGGEWRGKAGAYAIQGTAGLWVSGIRGEYSNVVGLPLYLLTRLFREWGFDLVRREWLPEVGEQEIATGTAQ